MTTTQLPRLLPTGNCWCGCGDNAAIGSFFARGHDKVAEAALLATKYGGSVPQLLHKHDYGPGRSVTDDAVRSGAWSRCAESGCNYSGTRTSVRNHQRKAGH